MADITRRTRLTGQTLRHDRNSGRVRRCVPMVMDMRLAMSSQRSREPSHMKGYAMISHRGHRAFDKQMVVQTARSATGFS